MKMDDLPNVYDLFFPSPPSLQELASIEIAISLWRRKIHQHITEKGTLREWMEETRLWGIIPDLGLPRNTELTIERYVIKLEEEIPSWVRYHRDLSILNFDVLNHFTDFMCDFDGSIHYRRTAERFVTCKGICDKVIFRMACNYCLEDDIYRIWPKVSSYMITTGIYFNVDCRLHYWLCRLRNQLHDMKATIRDNSLSIEEFILEQDVDDYNEGDWPTQEYFLNRLPVENGMKYMASIANVLAWGHPYYIAKVIRNFFRHILVRLNEIELKKFLNRCGYKFLFLGYHPYVLNVWAYIKNKMTRHVFCRLVRYIMCAQSKDCSKDGVTFYLYEIWVTAPDYLKQAAIQNILPNIDDSCIDRSCSSDQYIAAARRCVSFLLAMLSDTPIEVRRRFWNAHWNIIFIDIRPNDIYDLVKLCFDYDVDEVKLYKEEALSKNHDLIFRQLKKLVRGGFFKELEKFLTFWYSNIETIEELKKSLFS